MAQVYRSCPVTGFKVYKPAETLIKANAVAAVVFLLVGGISAIFVVLNRWLGVMPNDLYYMLLALHGWNMLIFWIILFEVAVLYFAGSVMLSARLWAPRLATLAFVLMVVGPVMIIIAILSGRGPEQNYLSFQPYPPLEATADYYLGWIFFAVGAIIALVVFFATVYIARRERTYEGSLPLVVYGAFVAAVLAVGTLLPGAGVAIPAFLWSVGLTPAPEPFVWKIVFWAYGHASQQINLAAMIAVWYLLAFLTVGGRSPSEKISRLAFALYFLSINLGSAHHLETEPALSVGWKWINTGYLVHLAVLGSMIHAFAVPGSVEMAQRARGYTNGLFQWLVRGPWRNPAFSSLILSVLLFGFLGGTTGVIAGTEQLSLKWHNTLAITGHFHAVVVTGTTLAFMGVTWYVLPLIFRRRVIGGGLAAIQPWLYGIGVGLLTIGMMQAGVRYGLPRKQADVFEFGGSPFAFDYPAGLSAWLGVVGVGGLLAIVGGALFVLLVVGTVLAGKPLTDEELRTQYKLPLPGSNPGPSSAAARGLPSLKGTFLACLAFGLFFAAAYAANYWNLSRAWPLG